MQLPLVQRTDQDGDARMETCYGSSTSYLMTWLWIPHASSRSSTYECGGLLRTFHLFSPRVSHSNTCRLLSLFVLCCCLSCCLVFVFLFHLFSPRVSHSNTCRLLSLFVLCCCLFGCLVFVFLVPVLQVFRNPEFSAQFRPR